MTWTDFRNHVVAQFLDADDQSEQARDAVRRVRAAAKQLQALSLVDDAPLKRCRELLERCRDADEALEAGEALVEASLKANAKELEAWRAKAMTTNDDSDDDEELIRPANPVQWQLTNSLQVEKAAGKNRVTSRDQIKFPRGGGRVEDLWGLSGGYDGSCVEVRRARVLCADGEQRDAYVVAMVPPKRGARVDPRTAAEARKACWRTYAAHRELSTSNGLCKAYGWLEEQPVPQGQRRMNNDDEDAPPGNGPWFVYERPKGCASDREYVGQGRGAEETTATIVRGVAARTPLVTGSLVSSGRHRSMRDLRSEGTISRSQTSRSEEFLRGRPRRLFKNGLDTLV